MKNISNQSFLNYLYKFIKVSGLLIGKEELRNILLSYNIIDNNHDLNISKEGFKFIDSNNLNDLTYPRLIKNHTNKTINNYNGTISKQMITMIEKTFYYIFLDKNIIKRNGFPTNKALNNRHANIFHCFPSDKMHPKLTISNLYKYFPQLKRYNHKNIIRDKTGLYYLNTLFIKKSFNEFEKHFNDYNANNTFDLSMVKSNYKNYIVYCNKSMTKELNLLNDMKEYIANGNYDADYNELNELESLLSNRQSISQNILNKELKYINDLIPNLS